MAPVRDVPRPEVVTPFLHGPNRLWSLWHMLEMKAAAFYEAARVLQHSMTFIMERKKTLQMDAVLKGDALELPKGASRDLRPALVALGAKITLMALDEFDANLAGKPTWQTLQEHTTDISKTLRRELTGTRVLSLSDHERLWFDPPLPPFGDKFEAGFRSQGNFELSEACKCLALGRSTAAVFHLMRVLEVGVRAMAACLGIPDPVRPAERNWSLILSKIMDDGIKVKWPAAADRMRPNCKVFEELHASLDAVKNPFRNSTMHIENKYTDAEAQHILALVKGFMMKLADRMDEKGEPKA